ncbi:MAG: hypothetical protein L3J95_06150 [Thermoplasmata archaeon]|nr:hypothetical protein [Thermoplasmata archaeon]MCI4359976.1 hypothetical protein [Thermoplasmata archaeon]
MEYIALKTVHPTWLTLQLPTEVAELLGYDPSESLTTRSPGHGLAYLSRGLGVVRVLSAFRARDVLPIEIVRTRYLATARPTPKLLHNLPLAVILHLGLQVIPRGPKQARSTDDGLLWFVPAPEYYEYRGQERLGKGWTGPSTGEMAHVYLARSLLPLPFDLPMLEELETRIEREEWSPRLQAVHALPRGRGR